MKRRRSWSIRQHREDEWGDLEHTAALLRAVFRPVEPRPEYASALGERLMIAAEVRLKPTSVVVEVRPPLWLAIAVPLLGAAYFVWRKRGGRTPSLAGLGL